MSVEQMLRHKLKNMPRIEPRTDRETVRQNVLAEARERARHSQRPRKYLLPVAFAGALVVFMFIVLAPWIIEQTDESGMELARSEMDGETEHSDTAATPSPDPSGEASDAPPVDDNSEQEELEESEADSGNLEQSTGDETDPQQEEQIRQDGDENAKSAVSSAPSMDYTGLVTKNIELEGSKETVVFDRYIFQPYGLQVLIPLRGDGKKWFNNPSIDGEAAVFTSRMEDGDDGQLMLSSITVSVYDDQSLEQVKQEEIASDRENAEESGYKSSTPEQRTLPNGERLIFKRTMQDQSGNRYTYYPEVFITEENGRTFAFHIGKSELMSEGFDPRLVDVVYPEFKVVQ